MFKRLSIISLLAALPVVGSGCMYPHIGRHPHGPGPLCGRASRAAYCGPVSGVSYDVGCGPAECDPCDPCGPCHYGHYAPLGPLAAIFRIFRPIAWMGPSCGERYWGDFYGEPPDCCDPCDHYGNYTGVPMCDCHRPAAGHVYAGCADAGCGPGCYSAAPQPAGVPRYATTPRPAAPGPREPAYLGQGQPRMPRPAVPVQQQPVYFGQRATHLRSPAGATSPNSQVSSQFAPRVISVDDRIVGEPKPQAATTARRIEAVQR